MSNQDAQLEAKIREMAKLSLLTNKINEIQEKNLKTFPFVFFNDVESVKIDYDFSNTPLINTEEDSKDLNIKYQIRDMETKHFRVSYHINLDKDKNNAVEKRFDALKHAVRSLFWNDIKVEVHFNDELVYSSEKDGKK